MFMLTRCKHVKRKIGSFNEDGLVFSPDPVGRRVM